MAMQPAQAYISNIQKFCIHDGPGLRTTVFFQGCPLRCKWCQNPENLVNKPVIFFNPEVCIGCQKCIEVCPQKGTRFSDGKFIINRDKCDFCGTCVANCFTNSRSLCGTSKNVDEVYDEVMKDEVFYRTTGGGITLSGGEATIYPDFIIELSRRFKDTGISVALETCGYCKTETLEALSQYVDVFLYDFKTNDSNLHKEWTAVNNELIKKNLIRLSELDCRVIVRIPLIPTVNTDQEFHDMMNFLNTVPNLSEINILPFHQVGSSKYMLIDVDYQLADLDECSSEVAEEHRDIAESYGYKVHIGGWDIA